MSSSISFRISDELKEKLEAKAVASGQSLSDLAKVIIEKSLEDPADGDYQKLFDTSHQLVNLVLANAAREVANEFRSDELKEYCERRLHQLLPKVEAQISKIFFCEHCGTEIETRDGQKPEYCPECEAEITAPGEPLDDDFAI